MNISTRSFGYSKENEEVLECTLSNNKGMSVILITYGGSIRKILVPDKDGEVQNMVLGYDTLEDYEDNRPHFGVSVGRYAGRINGGTFILDGKKIDLIKNQGNNFLHGGKKGLSKVNFKLSSQDILEDSVSVTMTYHSEAYDEGLPGNVDVEIKFSLNDLNEFTLDYTATTDARTPINLTNHTYFNIGKGFDKDILGFELKIDADSFLELNQETVGKSEVSVDGTPFDFRKSTLLSERINSDHPQVSLVSGFDHVFRLNQSKDRTAPIELSSKDSGITMSIKTDTEAVVLYTSNKLGESLVLSDGNRTKNRLGICLETQYFPNDVNSDFIETKTILDPSDVYRQTTTWGFKVK